MKSGQRGFTLIELLVVVAILGTLAGVVVLNVIQFIGRGACEAAKTELHNVQTAGVAYSYENSGAVPTAEVNPTSKGDLTNFLLTNVTGTYTWNASGVASRSAWPADCAH